MNMLQIENQNETSIESNYCPKQKTFFLKIPIIHKTEQIIPNKNLNEVQVKSPNLEIEFFNRFRKTIKYYKDSHKE